MGKIHFYEQATRSKLLHRRVLKQFLLLLFKKENTAIDQVDIIFCTDDYLLSLNRSFLDHNFFTDTLTFVLSEPSDPVSGELYISVDRVRFNASTYEVKYQDELVRVIIHSCLHLCGYEDKPKLNNQEMVIQQEKYLKRWNVSRETVR